VFLRSGQLTVYQGLPLSTSPLHASSDHEEHHHENDEDMDTDGKSKQRKVYPKRGTTLNIKFVKVSSMAFEISQPEDYVGEGGVLAEHKRVQRGFVPFVSRPRVSGEFFDAIISPSLSSFRHPSPPHSTGLNSSTSPEAHTRSTPFSMAS